jgi:hypothetical protein
MKWRGKLDARASVLTILTAQMPGVLQLRPYRRFSVSASLEELFEGLVAQELAL